MSFLLPFDLKYNKNGISEKNVKKLRSKYGSNRFTKKPRKSFFMQYLDAFADPIIKILLIALCLNVIIAFHNRDIYEPMGIALSLFLATFVSTLSEYASESAFLKLEKEYSNISCRVIRDKKLKLVNINELVVTDTVCLSSGERVPADGVIVNGSVKVDESSLNGESREVSKSAQNTCNNKWNIAEKNQLFRGAVITSGECEMTVGRVGDDTLYGSVASEIQTQNVKSPLTERLSALAKILAIIGYIAAGFVFFADLFGELFIDNAFNMSAVFAELGSPSQMITNLLHSLTLAITVVVVAVPEGLPMMITVVLSSNMKRLKKDNVLVRRLVGIETGGSVNILFCDKTGTLTKGQLSVTDFYGANGQEYKRIPSDMEEDLYCCCVLCNESSFVDNKAVGSNATDRAILEFMKKARTRNIAVTKRIAFDSTKKYAAVQVRNNWYIKGAPEVVMKKCSYVSPEFRQKLLMLTKQGVRVIALAKGVDGISYQLVGMLCVSDSLRHDAKSSVKTIQGAGINVCMITGDNLETACSIAKNCCILKPDGIVLTSEQMSDLSDDELIKKLPKLCVVARALPTDKSRLVRLSRKAGLACTMTGDGINDAPALKQADVGFAMGSGTEVAKQAGDIVILDDNITSVAKAILYGRTIFKSIRKFIIFQLTMNLCAVGISIIGPFIGVDTPVTVMQMLWINIIMDTLAGLAFAGEAPLVRYMKEKPVRRTEPVLSRQMLFRILFMGFYSLALCSAFLTFEFFRNRFGYYTDNLCFMTLFFALFIFTGIFGAFCARSEGRNIFGSLGKNKAFMLIFALIFLFQIWLIYNGGKMFRTVYVQPESLFEIVLLSASIIPFDIIRKTICKSFKKH